MEEKSQKSDELKQFSLSSAILAPLTALVQAQVHSSRAFLNYLLQLGYRHASLDEKNEITTTDNSQLTPFTLPFVNRVQINGQEVLQRIEIPALALVPSIPLGIESAEFEYLFAVDNYKPHTQLQAEREKQEQEDKKKITTADNKVTPETTKRPWFLVDDPVSFQGEIGAKDAHGEDGGSRQKSAIQIKIKVGQMAIPSGLDKLLTALTQSATAHIVPPAPPSPEAARQPDAKE